MKPLTSVLCLMIFAIAIFSSNDLLAKEKKRSSSEDYIREAMVLIEADDFVGGQIALEDALAVCLDKACQRNVRRFLRQISYKIKTGSYSNEKEDTGDRFHLSALSDEKANSMLSEADAAVMRSDFGAAIELSKQVSQNAISTDLIIRAERLRDDSILELKRHGRGRVTQVRPKDCFKKPAVLGSQENRLALYKDYRVESKGLGLNLVKGVNLYEEGLANYYRLSGSNEAAIVLNEGFDKKHQAAILFWSGLGIGVVAGVGGAAISNSQSNKNDASGMGGLVYAVAGVGLGLLGGGALGGIAYSFKFSYAKRNALKAADIFNKHLQKELELDLGIIEGNAGGKLTLAF